MKYTPRTDAYAVKWGQYKEGEYVDAERCREIELELRKTSKHLDIILDRYFSKNKEGLLEEIMRANSFQRSLETPIYPDDREQAKIEFLSQGS